MLQSIRDRAQGWLMWVIVIVLGLAFGFWGVARFVTNWNSESSPVVANINGQQISVDQYNTNFERLKRQLQLQYGDNFVVTPAITNSIKQQTVQTLIADTVLSQSAAKQGYRITQQQIDTVLASMPIFQVDGTFSQDRFQQILNNLLYSESDFLTQLRTDMLINQVQMGLINTAFALPSDVNNAYRLVNQTRDIAYFNINYQAFMEQVKISDTQISDFYNKNKDLFKTPEQVSLTYLELSLPQIQQQLNFSANDLQQYYQANLANYKTPAQWQVAHILVAVPSNATSAQESIAKSKIENIYKKAQPDSFASLAKQYSDDPISAKQGGLLPTFTAGSLGTVVQNAIANLKPQQFSKPIRTQYGYEIYQLISVKPSVQQTFEQAKEQVKQDLAAEKAQQIFADQSQQLSNITYSNPNSLDAAAKALNLTVQQTSLFTRTGGTDGISSNPKVIAVAFSPDVLVQGDNSDLIQLDPNTIVVVHVLQHIPAAVKPLAQVSQDIKQSLQTKAAEKLAAQKGETLIAELKSGKSMTDVSKSVNATVTQVPGATRHQANLNPLLGIQAFSLPRPASGAYAYGGLTMPNGDYAVIATSNVVDGNIKNMQSQDLQAYQQQLAANYGHLDFELYVRDQMANSKIKVDHAAIDAQTSTDNDSD